jgi:hypothetical protein
MTIYAQDGFGRTVSSGWGTADVGGAWTIIISTWDGDFNVNGTGTIQDGGTNQSKALMLNSVSVQDIDYTVKVKVNKLPTGTNAYIEVAGLLARRVSDGNFYRGSLDFTVNSNIPRVRLYKAIGGVESELAATPVTISSVGTPAADTYWKVRFQLEGVSPTTLRIKAWPASASEPGSWQATDTDSSAALQASGPVGVLVYNSSGLTNNPIVYTFDDLLVESIGGAGTTVKIGADASSATEVTTIVDTGIDETGTFVETAIVTTPSLTQKIASDTGSGAEGITRTGFGATKTASDTALGVDTAVTVVTPALSTTPTITVAIDWDANGNFTTAGDDVTSAVKSVTWTRGRSADFSTDAVGSATFVLNNSTGTYSPETNTKLRPGKPVLITSTYIGITRAHFYGYIQRITLDPKQYDVTIVCYDPMGAMSRITTTLPTRHRTHREIRLDALNAFGAGWRNLMDFNPSFETNTTGWTLGSGCTRITSDAAPSIGGSACVQMSFSSSTGINSRSVDASVAIGDVVQVSFWAKLVSGTANSGNVQLRNQSAGNIALDFNFTWPAVWTEMSFTFVCTAASAGLRLYLNTLASTTVVVDAMQMTVGPAAHAYSATGSGGLDAPYINIINDPSFETYDPDVNWVPLTAPFGVADAAPGIFRETGVAAYSGSYGATITPTIDANTGVKYDFGSRTFFADQPYIFSAYLKTQSSNANWQVGIGSEGTPTDVQTGQFTITSSAFTLAYCTWIPTADRQDVVAFIRAPNGSFGNGLRVDGVQCYPGSAVYPFEPTYADLDAEDIRAPTNASSGTIRAILDSVNQVNLTRHWIEATTTTPFWKYRTQSLATLAAKTVDEVLPDDDFSDFTNADLEADSIVNIQKVIPGTTYIDDDTGLALVAAQTGIAFASDGTSVDTYGRSDGQDISSALLENYALNLNYIQTIADAIVSRHSTVKMRPQITRINKWPSQLELDLDSMIRLTFLTRELEIEDKDFYVLTLTTTVTTNMKLWTTVYQLEEA